MVKSMAEIFTIISEQKTVEDRQNALRAAVEQVPTVAQFLQLAFDKNLVFRLPPGDPPYKPCEQQDQHGRLHQEMKKMYAFLNPNINIHPIKKETMFIQILESVDPDDAKMLLAAKDKKFLYKNINRKLIETTFPGMLTDSKDEQK